MTADHAGKLAEALEAFMFGDPALEQALWGHLDDTATGTVTVQMKHHRRAREALAAYRSSKAAAQDGWRTMDDPELERVKQERMRVDLFSSGLVSGMRGRRVDCSWARGEWWQTAGHDAGYAYGTRIKDATHWRFPPPPPQGSET
jgi:hypothetical protein